MRSENENEQIINNNNCVNKQVRIVKNSVSNDGCPRLSVRPGCDTGDYHEVWPGSVRIPRNPKKVKLKLNKSKSKPRVSGFFQTQLLMMKSRNKGKLSSNITQFSDKISSSSSPKQANNYQSSSISCPVLDKGKGKMTLFNGYFRIHGKTPDKMTLFDTNSPVLKKHRNTPGNRIHDLPKELLTEILKRLPVKYILRCRGVQKSWHSLIQSPYFITLQLNYQKDDFITITNASDHHYKYLFFEDQRATNLTIRFDDVQCREYCKLEFPPGLPKNAWFAVSYGLVCVSSTLNFDTDDGYNRNIYLWNPLVQKYKTLPTSPLPSQKDWEEWEALAFGFLPEVNDYVVLHIIKLLNSHSLIIGVYSLNTNSWKKLRRDNVSISRLFNHLNDVVFINGAAYWVGVSHRNKILMCFDTKTEILSKFSLPDWVEHDHIPVIYPFGQSIAFFVWEYGVHHFDMWVLKDTSVNEFIWEKKMCVSISKDVRAEVLGVRNNGGPILAKYNNFIAYNPDSYEANDFVDSWDRWTPWSPYGEGFAPPYVINPFVESLVLFDID